MEKWAGPPQSRILHSTERSCRQLAGGRAPSREQGQLTWPWQWSWPRHPSRRSLVRPALPQPSPRLVQKGQPRPTEALPWHCSSSAAAKQPAELACEAAASSPGCCMRCRPRQQPPAQGCSTRHWLRPSLSLGEGAPRPGLSANGARGPARNGAAPSRTTYVWQCAWCASRGHGFRSQNANFYPAESYSGISQCPTV